MASEDTADLPNSRFEAKRYNLRFYFTNELCTHGHRSARYTSTGQCVTCGQERAQKLYTGKRRSIEEQEAIARRVIEAFDFEYLGWERKGTKGKIHFRYDCGVPEHENRSVLLSNLERAESKKRYGESSIGICKACVTKHRYNQKPAHHIEELKQFARANFGGSCLSEKYERTHTEYTWKCSIHGHEAFEKSWNAVRGGVWCPRCWEERRGKDKRKPIEEIEAALDQWGGKIVGSEYRDGRLRLDIECPNGHRYPTDGTTALRHGCDLCKNKGERIARAFFEHNLGLKFPSSRPRWLRRKAKSRVSRLQLDGFSEVKKLAFEYQGPHHFKKEQVERDQVKIELCKQEGVRLIHIEYLPVVFPLSKWVPIMEKIFAEHGLETVFDSVEVPGVDLFQGELNEL